MDPFLCYNAETNELVRHQKEPVCGIDSTWSLEKKVPYPPRSRNVLSIFRSTEERKMIWCSHSALVKVYMILYDYDEDKEEDDEVYRAYVNQLLCKVITLPVPTAPTSSIQSVMKTINGSSAAATSVTPTRAMIKSRHKARQLYSFRPKVNDDPDGLWETCDHCGKLDKIHTDRDFNRCNPDNKIKRRLSSSKRSLAAQKAVRTKKRKQAIRKQKRSAAAKRAARTRKRKSQK